MVLCFTLCLFSDRVTLSCMAGVGVAGGEAEGAVMAGTGFGLIGTHGGNQLT